jgi:hypothetical protein
LQISQEVSIATLCKKESINFAYLKGTESDRAKLPFRAVCKFAFGGIDLRIYRLFILAHDLFKLAAIRCCVFLSGRALGWVPCV